MNHLAHAAMLSEDLQPNQSARGKAKAFVWHFLEMALAMEVGMVLFHLLFDGVLPPLGVVLERGTALRRIAMAVAMAIPMVAWMRVRGHSWRITGEMVAAMLAPAAAVITLCWLGVDRSLPWLGKTTDPVMYVGMLSAMLYRRQHYLGSHSHGRFHFPSPVRRIGNLSMRTWPSTGN